MSIPSLSGITAPTAAFASTTAGTVLSSTYTGSGASNVILSNYVGSNVNNNYIIRGQNSGTDVCGMAASGYVYGTTLSILGASTSVISSYYTGTPGSNLAWDGGYVSGGTHQTSTISAAGVATFATGMQVTNGPISAAYSTGAVPVIAAYYAGAAPGTDLAFAVYNSGTPTTTITPDARLLTGYIQGNHTVIVGDPAAAYTMQENHYTGTNPTANWFFWGNNNGVLTVIMDCAGNAFFAGGVQAAGFTGSGAGITGVPHIHSVPANSSSAGAAGDISYDSTHIYVCTATNTWGRATLSSF